MASFRSRKGGLHGRNRTPARPALYGKSRQPGNLVCPPYDVLRPGDRETYLARSPYNSMHLEVPDSYPQAADLLSAWTQQGILKRDSAPAMFIYEQEFSVRGETLRNKLLLCRMRLSDFRKTPSCPMRIRSTRQSATASS